MNDSPHRLPPGIALAVMRARNIARIRREYKDGTIGGASAYALLITVGMRQDAAADLIRHWRPQQ